MQPTFVTRDYIEKEAISFSTTIFPKLFIAYIFKRADIADTADSIAMATDKIRVNEIQRHLAGL